jgi:hypothetical protein
MAAIPSIKRPTSSIIAMITIVVPAREEDMLVIKPISMSGNRALVRTQPKGAAAAMMNMIEPVDMAVFFSARITSFQFSSR